MKYLVFIVYVCFGHFVFGQEETKVLEASFEHSKSDVEKAKIASDLAWKLKDSDPKTSLYYAKKALHLSRKTGQPKLEAYSLTDIGNYYKRREAYKEALNHYRQSLEIRQAMGEARIVASAYNQIGLLYKQQENYDSADVYFRKGLEIIDRQKDVKMALKLLDGHAMTRYHLGHPEEALACLDSSFLLAKQIKDSTVLANVLQRKGILHYYLKHPSLALKYYAKAKVYFQKLNNVNGLIDIMINESALYLSKGDRAEAERLLLEAERESISKRFESNLFSIYTNLAEFHRDNPDISKKYLEKAYQNAKSYNKIPGMLESGISLGFLALRAGDLKEVKRHIAEIELMLYDGAAGRIRLSYYRLKSQYLSKTNHFEEALNYSNKALYLKDSLQTGLNHLRDISAILANERHEKEMALQALKTSEAEQESIRSQVFLNQMIIGSLIAIISVLILLFFGKRKRLRVEHEKRIQEENFKAELQRKEVEADLLFLEESLKLETDIRQKIGRDLHDSLGSKLAVVQMTLESMNLEDKNGTIRNVTELVEESCQDMRNISHDLIRDDASVQSIDLYFSRHCEMISENGALKIEYTLIGEPYPIAKYVKKHLHAIVTLLLDNVIKHANAKKASLQLFYHDDSLNIEIADDGIGFQTDALPRSGVGLENAKVRIDQIGGTMKIDSDSKHGTIISISIPGLHVS